MARGYGYLCMFPMSVQMDFLYGVEGGFVSRNTCITPATRGRASPHKFAREICDLALILQAGS